MSGGIVGRAVNAVLIPPQAERFALLAGVEPNRLVLNVSGWNKLVLVDSERVFLFPRSADGVEWFERELAAYRALAGTRLDMVPRLLDRWEDRGRHAHQAEDLGLLPRSFLSGQVVINRELPGGWG